jgi:ribosomal protein S18 acetylase RimI-like enzyme
MISGNKMSKISTRRMHKNDLAVVSELAMLANPHATEEQYARWISKELGENPELALVAVDDGKVVGYALSEVHDNKEATLEDIAVAEDHQEKGIGSLLLSKTVKALKHNKARTVFAEVHYKCAAAIPFYYKHGFRVSGFGRDHFGMGHDAIILQLVLE